MKLASIDDGSRDASLVIVSRDLTRQVSARHIARNLQEAIEHWHEVSDGLRSLATVVEHGDPQCEAFDPRQAVSPLPRAYQWLDGSAFLHHMELARRSRGASMPANYREDPLIYQGGSDVFLAPHQSIDARYEAYGVDFEAEVAVIIGDVPAQADLETARAAIRLIMLVNDVTLRALVHGEFMKGLGFVHCKPASAFTPVAVTPDELGESWDGARLHRPIRVDVNDQPFGRANAGRDMAFDFPRLIAHAAHTRPLGAGTIIGSGTVSNAPPAGADYDLAQGGAGFSCIVEKRAAEQITDGAPRTPYLRCGDEVRIWCETPSGQSIFGSIRNRLM